MKNVLLLVHDDAGQEARFQAALDVVRSIEGHLTCLDVAVFSSLIDDGYGTAELLLDDERQREVGNREGLERRLGVEGLPWNWIDASGDIALRLTEGAGLADLIVVNLKLDSGSGPDMRGIASEVVLKGGKPILAVPETMCGVALTGHAMIAWDGSEEAISALQAAVPLLRLAQRVTIVEIVDGSVKVPSEAAAAYLSRHAVHASIHPKHPNVPSAGREILKLAELLKADYLVMGGFGHSRLREAIFGGVTRHMLTNSPVPLFLAH
ncbi:universal stress protein [Sphingomonas abietis]|uniref:Universal stress protein n=1 Tax=Sphingomonas abietis TaxID=3012344 RepID=A0ABY7NTT0_9SPHN|nr:universal stress protein [Sphingomonas abietis]WBO23851.1 universal stress protein [Sphingomonas abietis]